MNAWLFMVGISLVSQVVEIPEPESILRTLRNEHPRLIAPNGQEASVKQVMEQFPEAKEIYRQIRREAEGLLTARPIEYRLEGPRLLSQSRRCLDRVYTLATIYRLDGDERFAQRARDEMLVAAGFQDWNPSHFLDTAEMTHALAIGYDWLFSYLSEQDRTTIRQAILEKGLRPGEKVYRSGGWWSKTQYNWNQVCNGGMTLGALAIAEDEPEFAAWIVHQACRSVQVAMREFAPDGAYAEGPGYWNYATHYTVYMLAGLQTALGSDFGLSGFPGFNRTGDFRIHSIGPTRLAFNFADGSESVGSAPQMFWLARQFNYPQYAWHERTIIQRKGPLHLWWFNPAGKGLEDEPLSRHFRRIDVVMMRTSWEDPEAWYVGFKGGDNRVNHSHLELGSFVFDALGVRWATDLGPDNYNLPDYFGGKRWTYYRLGTAGQNTLWINGQNQDPQAVAPISRFESTGDCCLAEADLTPAYRKLADKVRRMVQLWNHGELMITDTIEGSQGAEIIWQMHTRASVEIKGSQAILSLGEKRLMAEISGVENARFETLPCNPPPPERQNTGITKLAIRITGSNGPITLQVRFRPLAPK